MRRAHGGMIAVAVLGLVTGAAAGGVWWRLLTAPQSLDHAAVLPTAAALGGWILSLARQVLAWL